jgi:hypothetical protein
MSDPQEEFGEISHQELEDLPPWAQGVVRNQRLLHRHLLELETRVKRLEDWTTPGKLPRMF